MFLHYTFTWCRIIAEILLYSALPSPEIIVKFNLRIHEDATQSEETHARCHNSFQSTHPWGCDKNAKNRPQSTAVFQSTHPWGCDLAIRHQNQQDTISIHASMRMRHEYGLLIYNRTNFNQRIHEDATYKYSPNAYKTYGFQSTHPWGCDRIAIDFPSC